MPHSNPYAELYPHRVFSPLDNAALVGTFSDEIRRYVEDHGDVTDSREFRQMRREMQSNRGVL